MQMNKKTSDLMNEALAKADEAFAKANKAFASVDWNTPQSAPDGNNDPTVRHLFDFAAPDWAHRRKLCRVFLKMAWQILRHGKTKLSIPKKR